MNKKQTDDYVEQLNNLKNEYEKVISEQKIRISDLKRELDSKTSELEAYKSKTSDISSALVVAVETAKQIESSSKNVYELEIKRLRNLYSRWESFLNDVMKVYPQSAQKFDSQKLLDEFSKQIDAIIQENSVSTKPETVQPIGIRNLISKMGGISARQLESTPKVVQVKRTNVQDDDSFDYPTRQTAELQIKPIANMTATNKDKNGLVDQFFEQDDEQENAYSKAIIRPKTSTGFDLKEALNPTEDLAEIMKDFDFFNDADNDNK